MCFLLIILNPNQKIFCQHDPNKFRPLCSNLSVPTLALPVLQLGFRAEAIDQDLTKKSGWEKKKKKRKIEKKKVESCSRGKMVDG